MANKKPNTIEEWLKGLNKIVIDFDKMMEAVRQPGFGKILYTRDRYPNFPLYLRRLINHLRKMRRSGLFDFSTYKVRFFINPDVGNGEMTLAECLKNINKLHSALRKKGVICMHAGNCDLLTGLKGAAQAYENEQLRAARATARPSRGVFAII